MNKNIPILLIVLIGLLILRNYVETSAPSEKDSFYYKNAKKKSFLILQSKSFAQEKTLEERSDRWGEEYKKQLTVHSRQKVADLLSYTDQSNIGNTLIHIGDMVTLQKELFINEELPGEIIDSYEETIARVFDQEKLLKNYHKHMLEEFSEKELAELNQLYEDPLLNKDRQDQTSTNSPEFEEELNKYYANISKNPISTDRFKLLDKIDRLTHGSENTSAMNKAIMETFSSFLGEKNSLENKDEQNRVLSQYLDQKVRRKQIDTLAFEHRNFSDGELMLKTELLANPVITKEAKVRKEVLLNLFTGSENKSSLKKFSKQVDQTLQTL